MIGVIACSKSKAASPMPARYLYTSQLFQKSLAYASRCCEVVYVASALHGLVELDKRVDPYNTTVADLTRELRAAWAHSIARELFDRHGAPEHLLLLAGAGYAKPIRAAYLACAPGQLSVYEPLTGQQIGERLRWLNQNTMRLERHIDRAREAT